MWGDFFFNRIGIIPLKSTELCWFTSAQDLAITLPMDAKSKVCHSWLSITTELHCRVVWEYFQRDSSPELFYCGLGVYFCCWFGFFALASLLIIFCENKRWNPVPLDSPVVLPLYSKFLTFKWIYNKSCRASYIGYNSLKALIRHISLKLSLHQKGNQMAKLCGTALAFSWLILKLRFCPGLSQSLWKFSESNIPYLHSQLFW